MFVAWAHGHLEGSLPDGLLAKALLVVLTWSAVFLVTRLTTRFFDVVDRRLTVYGEPERRLAKLDFLVNLFLILMGVFVTLFIMGVGPALWGAVAVTSVAGVIIGLAAQQLAQNLLAGIMILFERPFTVGDAVEMDGRLGTVDKVSLHSTTLVTPDGLHVLVPNARVLNAPITNFSAHPERRIVLRIDIFASDLEQVEQVLAAAVRTEEHLRRPDAIEAFVQDSLDEGNRWEVRYWVDSRMFAPHCMPSAMGRVVRALSEAGLETAMPAQRVHLDRGA